MIEIVMGVVGFRSYKYFWQYIFFFSSSFLICLTINCCFMGYELLKFDSLGLIKTILSFLGVF
jgi:hypothetical protein